MSAMADRELWQTEFNHVSSAPMYLIVNISRTKQLRYDGNVTKMLLNSFENSFTKGNKNLLANNIQANLAPNFRSLTS